MSGLLSGLQHSVRVALRPSGFRPRPPDISRVRYRKRFFGVAPLIDVYLPKGPVPAEGAPSVLLLHGGAFLVGSRRQRSVRFAASYLAQRGIAVAAADYRLLFRGGPLAAQLEDVAVLRRFWLSQAKTWHLDPSRLGIVGFSAGGALALLDAAQPEAHYQRVVSVYGVYEFASLAGPGTRLWRTALLGSWRPRAWAEASPAAVATAIDAPVLLLHGTEDALVPYVQAQRLAAAREAAGCSTTLRTFEGMRHGWMQDPSDPASASAMDDIGAFLTGYEKSPVSSS
ncbi:MAG: alpha/beta hydrolase [Myxococcota bacterium]